jgi:hypothetical protein
MAEDNQLLGYHGTPHTFEPVEHNPFGEFKDEAIGSGEGAQLYGYGHYIAENPAVARNYATKLSSDKANSNVLEVAMKPTESELLDWDVPLHQQQSIGEKLVNLSSRISPSDTGAQAYEMLSSILGKGRYNHRLTSQTLHKNGIPGIKYLDERSRNPIGPATYAGTSTPQQQLGLQVLNDSGQSRRWSPDALTLHQQLIDNYAASAQARAMGKQYILPGVNEKLAALQSLDPAKIAGPKQTRNYVIFDPSNIAITARNGRRLDPVDHNPFANLETVPNDRTSRA